MADNYVIPLRQVTNKKPRRGRAKKAIRAIKMFVKKHKRLNEDQIAISKEVNEKVWENGMFGIPRKIEVELKEREKEIKDKKKEDKKKTDEKEKETKEEIKAKEEQKKKLDEKRQKEKDAQKVDLKRKLKE